MIYDEGMLSVYAIEKDLTKSELQILSKEDWKFKIIY